MKRTLALLLICAGVTMFGVAAGLIYLDQRDMLLHASAFKMVAGGPNEPEIGRAHV